MGVASEEHAQAVGALPVHDRAAREVPARLGGRDAGHELAGAAPQLQVRGLVAEPLRVDLRHPDGHSPRTAPAEVCRGAR